MSNKLIDHLESAAHNIARLHLMVNECEEVEDLEMTYNLSDRYAIRVVGKSFTFEVYTPEDEDAESDFKNIPMISETEQEFFVEIMTCWNQNQPKEVINKRRRQDETD